MLTGDRVTVVHGLPPHGHEIARVVGVLPNGMIRVRLGDGAGAELTVAASMIDAGTVHVTSTRARATDPDTAHAAARAAAEHLNEHQWLVLAAFVDAGRAGLIDHEIEARNGLIQTSAGVRRHELQALGLVEPTGGKRRTPSNRLARVHRVTARGLAVHQLNTRRA